MSHYPQTKSFSFTNKGVAFEVGPNKDSYSIDSSYWHDHDTDVITHKHEVVKNWSYSEKPKTFTIKEGVKHRETLFSGTINECHLFIADIVNKQGHWIQDPNKSFNKIFVEPLILEQDII